MENIVLKMFQIVGSVRNIMPCINARIDKLTEGYHISYLEEDKTHVSFKITDDKCILLRKGIYSTNLHLNKKGESYARITSIYGNVESPIELLEIVCEEDHWSISYKMDEDQTVTIKWVLLKN